MAREVPRRTLLAGVSASVVLTSCSGAPPREATATPSSSGASTPAARGSIATRPLGSTGVNVSMIGLGGHHIGRPKDDDEGIRLVRMAIDNGVTFLDNCWDYNEGRSEERMGK